MKRIGALKESFFSYENLYLAFKKAYKSTKTKEANRFAFHLESSIFSLQEELIKTRSNKKAQALSMKSFITNLKHVEDKLTDWNEQVWMLLVDSAVVHRDTSITFKLNNGKEIKS